MSTSYIIVRKSDPKTIYRPEMFATKEFAQIFLDKRPDKDALEVVPFTGIVAVYPES